MTVYRAAWICPIVAPPIQDGWIAVHDGRIEAVGGPGRATSRSGSRSRPGRHPPGPGQRAHASRAVVAAWTRPACRGVHRLDQATPADTRWRRWSGQTIRRCWRRRARQRWRRDKLVRWPSAISVIRSRASRRFAMRGSTASCFTSSWDSTRRTGVWSIDHATSACRQWPTETAGCGSRSRRMRRIRCPQSCSGRFVKRLMAAACRLRACISANRGAKCSCCRMDRARGQGCSG